MGIKVAGTADMRAAAAVGTVATEIADAEDGGSAVIEVLPLRVMVPGLAPLNMTFALSKKMLLFGVFATTRPLGPKNAVPPDPFTCTFVGGEPGVFEMVLPTARVTSPPPTPDVEMELF